MKLQESGENYLETILVLHNETGFVRSIDVATALGVTKPSVSHAMMLLRTSGYITMDAKTNQIELTQAGREIAEQVYDRHCVLAKALIALGVDEETALADACKIEHDISDLAFEKIKEHVKKMDK